jgi:predicted GNAT family N-acyltransferase
MLDAAARAPAEGARAIDVTASRRAEGFYAKFGFLPLGETHTRFGPALRMRYAFLKEPSAANLG